MKSFFVEIMLLFHDDFFFVNIPSSSPEDVKSAFRFLFIGVAVSNSLGGLIKVLRAVLDVLFIPGVKNLLRESTKPLGLFSKLLDGSNLMESGITGCSGVSIFWKREK